jgi:excisionase family DNA binding protein
MDGYLSVQEVAKIVGASAETVRRWIRVGRLQSVTLGRRRFVRRVDVDHVLRRACPVERRATRSRRALVLELLAQLDRHARFLHRALLLLSPGVRPEGLSKSEYECCEQRVRRIIETRFEARLRQALARAGFRNRVSRRS